jgi:hypothetical protein
MNDFLVLLKDFRNLIVSWRIGVAEWKGISGDAATTEDESSIPLFVEVYYVREGVSERIDEIPVHNRENSWHIFMHDGYYGKRIFLRLAAETTKGRIGIAQSDIIEIPVKNPLESELDEMQRRIIEVSGIEIDDEGSGFLSSR